MNQFDQQFFGENLRKLRKRKGLTQSQVAEKLGVTQSNIGGYETGKNLPSLFNLLELAKLLEVSLDKLIYGDESKFIDVSTLDGVEKEENTKIAELKRELDSVKNEKDSLKREINTLRSYNARLERDLERYEKDDQGSTEEHRETG